MRGICKMINKVGRDIPEEILKATGKKIFEGAYVYDNFEYKKPRLLCVRYLIRDVPKW